MSCSECKSVFFKQVRSIVAGFNQSPKWLNLHEMTANVGYANMDFSLYCAGWVVGNEASSHPEDSFSLFDVCIMGTISLWGSMPLSQDVTLVIKQNDRRVQGWNPTGESSHIAPRSFLTSKVITFALTQVYSVERSSSTKPVAFEYKSWSAVLFGRAC